LRAFWAELGAFEEAEYRRTVVQLWAPGAGQALLTVANLHEAGQPDEA
jgi:hypothetical protein